MRVNLTHLELSDRRTDNAHFALRKRKADACGFDMWLDYLQQMGLRVPEITRSGVGTLQQIDGALAQAVVPDGRHPCFQNA